MSLFDFLAPKKPFVSFSGKIKRLRALLNVMEQKVQREYFMQLKGHIKSIPFSGRISNGFTGTNIQKVIRQLGVYIVASRGRHPYKIIFPGKGQLGFSFTISPSAFLKEVSHLTGVDQKILETAFRLGELVH